MAFRGWNPRSGFDLGSPPPGTPGFYQTAAYPQYHGWPSYYGTTASFGWGQYPQQWPNMNPPSGSSIPGTTFHNDLGGVGIPYGYNYLFSEEHCKFHVFKTPTPPWERTINIQDPTSHEKCMVPTNVTVQELMQQLGCNNKDPKKNKLYEVTRASNGTWKKGLVMCGDDKARMKTKITDWGWDKTRTGKPGERSVVWIWLTKD
ncbi:hypothetical protein BP6252_09509 [Coleophoma cylindrospora]|uniref:Uncharacterized protein n=1 Tax=Coleophoma cylindrospora TaxID=1849047 RepID=A0A3D8R244_9HELO|nr:hypothetical protein BP6252_09509 [Coleophoma cylindrospora]